MTIVNNTQQNALPDLRASGKSALFCIAIGYSAGGFEALRELLTSLPASSNNLSIILSQPLEDAQFVALEILLAGNHHLHMRRPLEDDILEPGHIYAAKPDEALKVDENRIIIQRGRHAADVFFTDALLQSLAVSASDRCIAVILSGTGNDGSAGVKSVKAAGGKVLVQRPETSKYDGMPKAAICTGCADSILDPVEIGNMIGHIIIPQSLSLKEVAGEAVTSVPQQARLVVMNNPVLSVENMVKETLYASYQHTYIIIDRECNILEVNGEAAMYLDLKAAYLPCYLYDVLQKGLQVEVKSLLDNALNHGILNKGKLEIFELDNEIVFIRIMVKRIQYEKERKEFLVLIFENLDPRGFTPKGLNAGKLMNGLEFQQFAKHILTAAKSGF